MNGLIERGAEQYGPFNPVLAENQCTANTASCCLVNLYSYICLYILSLPDSHHWGERDIYKIIEIERIKGACMKGLWCLQSRKSPELVFLHKYTRSDCSELP